jgi:hypothetical protein
MIAFHTATAQALAAKTGDKDSKLKVAKKKILQACCGQALKEFFTTPGVYLDMDVEGGTTDALGQILRRRMKTIVGSPHKSIIYVTPRGQNPCGVHQGDHAIWNPLVVGRGHE